MITQQDAQSCDLFVYAAVQLALDKTREENGLKIALTSVDTGESDEVNDIPMLTQIYYTPLIIMICVKRDQLDSRVW